MHLTELNATGLELLGLTSAQVIKMKRHSFFLCCLTLTAGIASAQPAIPTIPLQYTFAPAGLAGGQTMRLNLANVGTGTSVCMANLSFVNSDATTIKNQDFTVKAGQTMSYPLVTSDITATPVTAEVRGFVKIEKQVLTPGTTPTAPCSPVMSLELVVNATGQSQVVLTNPLLVTSAIPVLASVPPFAP
jgi:hypothetical protein